MEITREELEVIIRGAVESAVATAQEQLVISTMEKAPTIHCGGVPVENPTAGKGGNPRSAYAKTESLLYNYNNFSRIVEKKRGEILYLQENGVPQRSKSIVQWGGGGNPPAGIILPSESVESAIYTVQASLEKILRVLDRIDQAMEELVVDPYYRILKLFYFDRLTQEQIAVELGCSQVTVSKNKKRLVRELATRIFPEQVIEELMN